MTPSADVANGEGFVDATRAEPDGPETRVAVSVKHLPPPARVNPAATVYVVWLQRPDGGIRPLGTLLLGADADGSLEKVTALTRFRLFVTPEANPAAVAPTAAPVLSSEVSETL